MNIHPILINNIFLSKSCYFPTCANTRYNKKKKKRKNRKEITRSCENTPKNSPISLRSLKRNYRNTRGTSSAKFIAITLHPHIYLATYNYAFNRVPIELVEEHRGWATGDQWADSLASKKNPSPLLQFPILIFFLYLSPSPPFPRSHPGAIHPGISGCNVRLKRGGCVHGDQGNLVTITGGKEVRRRWRKISVFPVD